MLEKTNLVILVIASINGRWGEAYINYINYFWVKFINHINDNNINIKVFLLFGENPDKELLNLSSENMIISNIEENYKPGILKKTIHAFDYVNKKYDYKHILRTNLSSFFIIDKLIELNNKIPTKKVYYGCGPKQMHCGAAIWFSRDVIEYILLNKKKLMYNKIDDWAFAILMKSSEFWYKNMGLTKEQIKTPRYDIQYNALLHFERNFPKIIKKLEKRNYYHVRVVLKKSIEERTAFTKITKKLTEYFYSV